LDSELDILVGLHPVFRTLGGKTGFANAIKGISIARGITTAEDTLSGPKVRSFYSNIVDPNGTRVTIDTWMYRIMLPEDFAFIYRGKTDTVRGHEKRKIEEVKVQDIFQKTPKGFGVGEGVGLYPIFSAAIRRAAIKYNMPPSAIQAIIWEMARQEDGKKPTNWDKVEAAFIL